MESHTVPLYSFLTNTLVQQIMYIYLGYPRRCVVVGLGVDGADLGSELPSSKSLIYNN